MKKIVIVYFIFTVIAVTAFSQSKEYFTNPILAGFYPDPSICKVGDDYYLINSTFAYYPGLPIFHSKDLVNWTLIGHALDRPEQLNLDGAGVSRGLFAPAIEYHEGVYYVTCTQIDGGGNFVVTAKDPAGPWSNPVWLKEVLGIDPSLYFDDDGKAYIVYNSDAPDNKPLYSGHRTIRIVEFDYKNLKVATQPRILVNGGTNIEEKPIWIEGPHIYKKDGYYYLMAAQGGTAHDHSEVIFRSKSLNEPFEPYKNNPILTQKHLDPERKNPITSTGHADLVEGPDGEWWAVFLGCRPYSKAKDDYYNTGRETFLAPVKWKDGWPIINPDFEEVQYRYSLRFKTSEVKPPIPLSGNFTIRDNFEDSKLRSNWIFLRTVRQPWYDLSSKKGYLSLRVRPETSSEKVNPSFVAHRQQHLVGSASTALEFDPKSDKEKAGLIIFQNENYFYFLCKSLEDDVPVVQLFKSKGGKEITREMDLLASRKLDPEVKTLHVRIETDRDTYTFSYATAPGKWNTLKDGVDGKFLSIREAGGFVGAVFALYATSLGSPSTNSAAYDWFEYTGNDPVYNER